MKTRGILKSLVLIGIFLLVFQWVMGPQAWAGAVVGWGEQVTPTSQLACISAISAGGWHSLALKRVLPPLEVSMNITPRTLNTGSGGKWVKAHITLPEEIYPEDIDINEPAIAYPMDIESESITVHGGDTGPVKLEVAFGRQAFCDLLTDEDSLEITVIGSLTTGQYFYGTDTIRIIPRRSSPKRWRE